MKSGAWKSSRLAILSLLKILPVALLIPACSGKGNNSSNPPIFAGLTSATNLGAGSLTAVLVWSPATDLSGSGIASYNVFYSILPGAETLQTAVPGSNSTGASIPVTMGVNTYYFIVQAVDGNGNSDGNAVERVASIN